MLVIMKVDKSLLVPPAIEQKLILSKARLHEEISNYLKHNPMQSLNGISHILKVHHKSVYAWFDGNFQTPLKRNNIEKLAELLEVNPLYLTGDSNFRIAINDEIDLKHLVGEDGLIGLRQLQESIEYSKEYEEYITYIDLKYTDIISAVIGNTEFWRTLIHEAHRIIQLKTMESYQNEFERVLNKDDDNILDNPTKLEDIEIVHQINAKALNKVFDAYIEDKIKHHKIVEKDFEEKGSNNISIQ